MFNPFFVDITACLNSMLRKGTVFTWTEQCNNAFKLLRSELVKMPRLQYPNPNKPFKVVTVEHSYSGILHHEETPNQPGAEVNVIPIAYFSGSFGRTQQLWNTTQKECYTVYWSIQKFAFYLAGTKCMLYCDHKPSAPFFTTGMSSTMLDRWAVELQQFDLKFQHIQVKRNMVANVISRLRTLGLYQDNGNNDVPLTLEDVVKNIMQEVHSMDAVPKTAAYKMGKLNLDVLRKEQ